MENHQYAIEINDLTKVFEVPERDAGLKAAIKDARPVGNRIGSPWLHVASKLIAETRRVAPGLGRSGARAPKTR